MALSPADFEWPSSETAEQPYAFYEALRAAPVYRHPLTGVYLVSRWEDIAFVTQHPDVFRQNLGDAAGADHLGQAVPDFEVEIPCARRYSAWPASGTDGPDHRVKRGWALRIVDRERLRSYEPLLRALADELIEAFAARGECEFRSEFAELLPAYVMCDLLGLPRDDARMFQQLADEVQQGAVAQTEREIEQARRAWTALNEYMLEAVLERRERPRQDLLSELLQAQVERDGLVDINFQVAQGVNLILAGSETTAHMLTSTMLLLCLYPQAEQRVREDRRLLRPLLEESMRLETPVQWLPRLCVEATAVGDVEIPAGAVVALLWASGNRDAAKFPDPGRFDLDRPSLAKSQLAFGRGAHLCAGAALARLEGEIAFDRLLTRLQRIRLDEKRSDFRNIVPSPDTTVLPQRMHGPRALVLTFENA